MNANLRYRIEDRKSQVWFAALSGRDAAHHLSPVSDGLLTVERTLRMQCNAQHSATNTICTTNTPHQTCIHVDATKTNCATNTQHPTYIYVDMVLSIYVDMVLSTWKTSSQREAPQQTREAQKSSNSTEAQKHRKHRSTESTESSNSSTESTESSSSSTESRMDDWMCSHRMKRVRSKSDDRVIK